MNRFLFGVARAVTETFTLPEPILEIGAYQVDGQEQLSLRRLFPGVSTIGKKPAQAELLLTVNLVRTDFENRLGQGERLGDGAGDAEQEAIHACPPQRSIE